MRRSVSLAFDSKAFDAAIKAGHGLALIQQLKRTRGVDFDSRLGAQEWLLPNVPLDDFELACDAQPSLATAPNQGIPAYLANILDPKVIRTLVSPMKAAQIAGETGKGNWTSETIQFLTVEDTGTVAAYGDRSNNGMSNANANFPQRQNFLFQAFLTYGEREVAKAALAKLDWVSQQQQANALTLAKYLNNVYFFGVSQLQNYGLINDPTLPPALTPTFSWLTSASTTAYTIYQDVVRMFIQLQNQSNGVVEMDAPVVLAMSPKNMVALKEITQYNTNSVLELLKENFPNIRIETAVQYSTAAGELVQMFVEELDGQRTVEVSYSAKMMAHMLIADSSSWKQKRTSGGWGAIWYRPYLCVSMLG